MDGADSRGRSEHAALLRALRSALEAHGPVLSTGFGARASVEPDPDRRRQGGADEGGSCAGDPEASGGIVGALSLDTGGGGNSADATSAPPLHTDQRQREAAESLCAALRTFLLGWDGQNHLAEPVETPHPNSKSVCGASTDAVVAERPGASGVEQQFHSLGGQLVSLLFGAFGPTDGQLRSSLLQILPMLKRNTVREGVLGWLVRTVPSFSSGGAVELMYEVEVSSPPDDNDDGTQESDGRASGPIAFDAIQNVMDVLQTVVKSDPTSLVPVVNCLSSILPSLSDQHANTVSKICIAGLKVVEAEELPCLIRCLFQSIRFVGEFDEETSHDMSDEDRSDNGKDGASQHDESGDDGDFDHSSGMCIGAIQAIRAVRTEWDLIESEENGAANDTEFDAGASSSGAGAGDVSVLVSIAGVLCESLLSAYTDPSTSGAARSVSPNCLRGGYLSVVRGALDQHGATNNAIDKANAASAGSGMPFSGLDVVAVLALFSCRDSREEVEAIINDLYLMRIFPFGPFTTILINSVMTSDDISLRTKNALRCGLHDLCLCLLLCPLRCRKFSIDASASTQFLHRVELFVSESFEAFSGDEKGRCEFISSLVDLSFVGSSILRGQKGQPRTSKNAGVPTVKRSSGRSQRATQFLVQCAHRVEHSSLQVLKNMLGNTKWRGAMIQYRREFVGNLFTSSSAMTTADPALIDLCSGVTTSLFLDPTGRNTNSGEDLLALVQRLLFVAPQPDGLCLHLGNFEMIDGERLSLQMMGLSLCRRLICCQALSQSQRDTIWSWAIRIMRSQFSPTMGGRSSEFQPVLGLAGLLVLMEGCGRAPSAYPLNMNTNPLHDIPARPSSEIYGMLKVIVARTGLIQLETKVSTLIEKSKSRHACYYATMPPAVFAPSNDEFSSRVRRMTFSVAGYVDSLFGLNNSGTNALSIDDVYSVPGAATLFRWCFTLLDTYLELGREASGGKWSPDGWLAASFILCRFPQDEQINASTLTDCSSKILSALRHAHGCVAAMAMGAAVLKNAHSQYSALCLSGTKDSSAKAKKLLRLIQYQLSVIYDLQRRCLSTLAFIEKGTKSSKGGDARKRGGSHSKKNAPKKRQRGGSDASRKKRKKKKKGKSGGDRLIGNYDASRRIRYLESLNDIGKATDDDDDAESGQEKMTLPGEDGSHSLDPQDAVSQEPSNEMDAWLSSQCQSIRGFLSDQMSDANFIPQELLCNCLFNEDDGATLVKFVDKLIVEDDCAEVSGEDSALELLETKALQIIWLRRAISAHLTVLIRTDSVEMPSGSLLSLIKVIALLSRTLKILRSNGHRPMIDKGPTVILPVLLSDEALHDVFVDDARTLLSAYYDILAATIQSDRFEFAQNSGRNESTGEESESSTLTACFLYHELKKQLLSCEDGVLACQIIDLVAIIAVKTQDSDIDGLELSWKTLTTVYAGCSTSEVMSPEVSSRLLRRPPAFCRVIQQCTRASGAKKDAASALSVLDRFASTSTRLMKENVLIRYSLLNHWALIMTKFHGPPCADLRKLVQSLRLYVQDMSRDLRVSTSSRRSHRKSRQPPLQAKSKCKTILSEDSAADVDIPHLTAKSFPVFYEGLLYAIVVSFALANPGVKCEDGASPFKDIQVLSRLFRDMAEMFTESSKLFPQRTMGAVVRACALVVSTCERQVIDCSTWRNKQPFLPSADADADYASSAFLQTLIDNMAFNCAGSAILFGDLVKSQAKQRRSAPSATGDGPRNGSDEDDGTYFDDSDDDIGVGGEDWAYGSNQKAVANLLLQGEKVIDALRGICTSYNLRPPRVRMTKSEMREVASRDRILSKVKDEEKKEASSSDERPRPGQEAMQPARALPAFTVRRKGKRKAASEESSSTGTHAGKKGKRRIAPNLVTIQSDLKEDEQTPAANTNDNVESGKKVAEQTPNSNNSLKMKKDEHSDSDESFKSKDSFGIDGGWGSNDDDDAGAGPSASEDGDATLSMNFLQVK